MKFPVRKKTTWFESFTYDKKSGVFIDTKYSVFMGLGSGWSPPFFMENKCRRKKRNPLGRRNARAWNSDTDYMERSICMWN